MNMFQGGGGSKLLCSYIAGEAFWCQMVWLTGLEPATPLQDCALPTELQPPWLDFDALKKQVKILHTPLNRLRRITYRRKGYLKNGLVHK